MRPAYSNWILHSNRDNVRHLNMFTFMIGSIKFLFYRLYVFYAKLEWVFEIL